MAAANPSTRGGSSQTLRRVARTPASIHPAVMEDAIRRITTGNVDSGNANILEHPRAGELLRNAAVDAGLRGVPLQDLKDKALSGLPLQQPLRAQAVEIMTQLLAQPRKEMPNPSRTPPVLS